MKSRVSIALVLAASTSACVRPGGDTPGAAIEGEREGIVVPLADGSGRAVAIAQIGERGNDVRVDVAATGMTPGIYGMHVHMVGRCDAPGFESAGAHWNPGGRQHGRDNPAGAHAGDLPNLTIGTNGRGTVGFTIAGATLNGGVRPMSDADGAALLIHAAVDDYRTDPSGNSGARIACGVVARPR